MVAPPSPPRPARLSRRRALAVLVDMGACAAGLSGCVDATGVAPPPSWGEPQRPSGPPGTHAYADSVDALLDVIVPAEHDEEGALVSPGAREAGAAKVLAIDAFATLAVARGLLPPLPDDVVDALAQGTVAFRAALAADLDLLAALERPLTPFRDLPRALQESVVDRALDDPLRRPVIEVVRAACFVAYLGAVESDVGLRAVGYPPFEDFADGLAVSGYPRTPDGRLIDAENEDLAALATAGELDDYTWGIAPKSTPNDDLSVILDEHGDLY